METIEESDLNLLSLLLLLFPILWHSFPSQILVHVSECLCGCHGYRIWGKEEKDPDKTATTSAAKGSTASQNSESTCLRMWTEQSSEKWLEDDNIVLVMDSLYL